MKETVEDFLPLEPGLRWERAFSLLTLRRGVR